MVFLKALVSALALLATSVSGAAVIYNNCNHDVTIYRHSFNDNQYFDDELGRNVTGCGTVSETITIKIDETSDPIETSCDVFTSPDFLNSQILNADGSVNDKFTCDAPGESCYDEGGPHYDDGIFNVGNDGEIYLCTTDPYPTPSGGGSDVVDCSTLPPATRRNCEIDKGTLSPSSPTPEPNTPDPSPSPEPNTPSPEPNTPSPEPNTPSPEPNTPSPEPNTPSPKPNTPSPKPNTPVPSPSPKQNNTAPSPSPKQNNTAPSPSPKQNNTDNSSSSSSVPVGLIVGASVGGAVALIATVVLIAWCVKRNRNRGDPTLDTVVVGATDVVIPVGGYDLETRYRNNITTTEQTVVNGNGNAIASV
jgi:hypothetical protein